LISKPLLDLDVISIEVFSFCGHERSRDLPAADTTFHHPRLEFVKRAAASVVSRPDLHDGREAVVGRQASPVSVAGANRRDRRDDRRNKNKKKK
jgi:hypothetical protein